jgi:hypothetical protein
MHRSFLTYLALFIFPLLTGCRTSSTVALSKDVVIVSREQWGSANPVLPMKKHVPNQITIHHTATKQAPGKTLTDKLKGLQKFSIERSPLGDGRIKEPWADIPYHFYIAVDGSIGEGRELQYAGDSNTPYDPSGHALIVLEGNFENEEVSEAQQQSMEKLVLSIAKLYDISGNKISGHKDNASTLCPGKNLYSLIPGLKKLVLEKQGGR